MIDYVSAINVSASSLDYNLDRIRAITANVANASTPYQVDGTGFRPLKVIASSSVEASRSFDDVLKMENYIINADVVEDSGKAPRMVHDPGHPQANADGFVLYPGVDTTDAMLDLMAASRNYEANLKVISVSKSMALKVMEMMG